jgi:hypothetical protein
MSKQKHTPSKPTVREMAQIFVDYGRLNHREFDMQHGDRVRELHTHFNMPPMSRAIDTILEAMSVALKGDE